MRTATQIKRNQQRFDASYLELHTQFAPYEGDNDMVDLMTDELDNLLDYRNLLTKLIVLKKRQVKLGNKLPAWTQVPPVVEPVVEPIVEPVVEPCETCPDCDRCMPDSPCDHDNCECHICDWYECTNDRVEDCDLCAECDAKWIEMERIAKQKARQKAKQKAKQKARQKARRKQDEIKRKQQYISPWDKAIKYFELHGVTDFSTWPAIKRAYRKLALRYHPDKNNGNDIEFKKITAAYEVLMSHSG